MMCNSNSEDKESTSAQLWIRVAMKFPLPDWKCNLDTSNCYQLLPRPYKRSLRVSSTDFFMLKVCLQHLPANSPVLGFINKSCSFLYWIFTVLDKLGKDRKREGQTRDTKGGKERAGRSICFHIWHTMSHWTMLYRCYTMCAWNPELFEACHHDQRRLRDVALSPWVDG